MTLDIQFTGGSARRHMAVLLIGPAGAGKTRLPSSFPSPFYAAAEANLMSIEDRPTPVQRVLTSAKLKELKAFLDQAPDVREQLLGFPVETLVVDTLDEVQRILKAEREAAKRKWERDDWGWLAEELRALVRGFRLLTDNGMNVVMTVHQKDDKDEGISRIFKKPALQGQMCDELSQYFDVVGLLRMELTTQIINGKPVSIPRRWLQTYPDDQWECLKDSSGKLPYDFEIDFETDYDRMYQAIYGSAPAPVQQASIVVSTDVATGDASAALEDEAVVDAAGPGAEPEVDPVEQPEPEPEPSAVEAALVEEAPEPEPEVEPAKPARASRATTAKKAPAAPKAAPAAVPEPESEPVAPEPVETEPVAAEPAATNGNAAEPEVDALVCEECRTSISEDDRDLSQYKLDRDLCRDHYKAAMAAAKSR